MEKKKRPPRLPKLTCPESDGNSCSGYLNQRKFCQDCPLLNDVERVAWAIHLALWENSGLGENTSPLKAALASWEGGHERAVEQAKAAIISLTGKWYE